ncbi:hypothetical protein LEMLEM_LOCUS20582, partial [Lemmus lemmus]
LLITLYQPTWKLQSQSQPEQYQTLGLRGARESKGSKDKPFCYLRVKLESPECPSKMQRIARERKENQTKPAQETRTARVEITFLKSFQIPVLFQSVEVNCARD